VWLWSSARRAREWAGRIGRALLCWAPHQWWSHMHTTPTTALLGCLGCHSGASASQEDAQGRLPEDCVAAGDDASAAAPEEVGAEAPWGEGGGTGLPCCRRDPLAWLAREGVPAPHCPAVPAGRAGQGSAAGRLQRLPSTALPDQHQHHHQQQPASRLPWRARACEAGGGSGRRWQAGRRGADAGAAVRKAQAGGAGRRGGVGVPWWGGSAVVGWECRGGVGVPAWFWGHDRAGQRAAAYREGAGHYCECGGRGRGSGGGGPSCARRPLHPLQVRRVDALSRLDPKELGALDYLSPAAREAIVQVWWEGVGWEEWAGDACGHSGAQTGSLSGSGSRTSCPSVPRSAPPRPGSAPGQRWAPGLQLGAHHIDARGQLWAHLGAPRQQGPGTAARAALPSCCCRCARRATFWPASRRLPPSRLTKTSRRRQQTLWWLRRWRRRAPPGRCPKNTCRTAAWCLSWARCGSCRWGAALPAAEPPHPLRPSPMRPPAADLALHVGVGLRGRAAPLAARYACPQELMLWALGLRPGRAECPEGITHALGLGAVSWARRMS
jgi:hypothetical protein